MANKSIGELHATVTANAAQFISEFNRADNAARRSSANISKEVSELATKTAKKFQLGDVAKDALKGAGLFGGFDLARTASEAIVAHFKEAAEWAEKVAEASDRWLENSTKIRRMNMNSEQVRDDIQKERDQLQKELSKLQTPEFETKYTMGADYRMHANVVQKELTEQQRNRSLELKNKISDLDVSLEEAKKRVAGEEDQKADERRKRFGENYRKAVEAQEKIERSLIQAGEKLAEAMQTPAEKYAETMKNITALRERGVLGLEGGFTDEQGRRAQAFAQRQFDDASDPSKSSLTSAIWQRFQQAAGGLKIDEMTKRGLGTGADYRSVQQQQTNVLIEIRELLKRWINNPTSTAPTYD